MAVTDLLGAKSDNQVRKAEYLDLPNDSEANSVGVEGIVFACRGKSAPSLKPSCETNRRAPSGNREGLTASELGRLRKFAPRNQRWILVVAVTSGNLCGAGYFVPGYTS